MAVFASRLWVEVPRHARLDQEPAIFRSKISRYILSDFFSQVPGFLAVSDLEWGATSHQKAAVCAAWLDHSFRSQHAFQCMTANTRLRAGGGGAAPA